eukprot:scaffold85_cov175-Ochromonas_danica.AAC.12
MADDQPAEQILVLAERMMVAHPFLPSERMVFSSSGSFALMPATGQEVSVDLWRALHDAEEALLHISESNDRVGESRGDLLESNGPVQHSARKENSDVNLATLRQEDLYEDHDIQPKTLFGGEELLAASVLGEQDKSAAAEDDLCQLPPDLLSKLIEDSDSKVQWDSSDNSSTVSCNLSDPLELNLWDERLWLSSRTFHLPFPQEIALPAEKDLLEDLADSVEHHTTASWPSTPTNKQIDSRSSVKRPRVDAKSSRSFHPTQRSFSRRARRRLSAWLSLHDELAKYNVTLMGVLLDTQSKSHGTSIEALLPGLPTRCVRILFGLDEMYRHGLRPVSWFSDDFLHPHSYLAAEALAQLPIGRHLPHFSFASSLTDSLNVVENGKDLWPVRETLQRLADACMKLPATFPWTEKEKLILDWNSLRPRLFAPLTYLSTRTLLCSSSTVPNQQSLDEVHKLGRAQEIYEEIQESAAICVGELNTQRRLQDILYELYSLGCGTEDPSDALKQLFDSAFKSYSGRTASIQEESFTIPIYFHVLLNNDGEGNVSSLQISNQVEVLNARYSEAGFLFTLQGVDYTTNSAWFNMAYGSSDEQDAKTSLRKGWCNMLQPH